MSKRKKGTVLFRLIDGGDERISRRCPEDCGAGSIQR